VAAAPHCTAQPVQFAVQVQEWGDVDVFSALVELTCGSPVKTHPPEIVFLGDIQAMEEVQLLPFTEHDPPERVVNVPIPPPNDTQPLPLQYCIIPESYLIVPACAAEEQVDDVPSFIPPFTSNLAAGAVVPIPTLPFTKRLPSAVVAPSSYA